MSIQSPANPAASDSSEAERVDRGRLVAIGNFDGVHRGHQYLVAQVLREAAALGLRPAVMTFDPHPAVVLGRPVQPPLTRLERKLELLGAASPELELLVEHFDSQLAQMAPLQFVETVLCERHRAKRVLVGENFRFGRGRSGNLNELQRIGAELGFSADALPLLQDGGLPISSSRVREALRRADVREAAYLLGRRHAVRGRVVRGRQLGRTLGFPTANFGQVQELLPLHGVYSCWVGDGQSTWGGVCNIGTRPTVEGDGQETRLEVHLFGSPGDLYERSLELEFVGHVRAEQRFAGLDALKQQIALDVEVARSHLERA